MHRFSPSFQGVRFDIYHKCLIWEFDLDRSSIDRLVEEFTSNSVSDGFIKAATIALLVSLYNPPALILIEEIENGINPGNIKEIMNWIWQATALEDRSHTPQFILTTHSPSVLREFHKHLDCIYTTRLKKKGFQSDVRNLGQSLDTLIGIGAVEGETLTDPETGKLSIEMPQYQLAELWYSGTIG
ncbi:MAG: AAA family ATPase [Cyanobacteria bacterium P01_E01_bin.42]